MCRLLVALVCWATVSAVQAQSIAQVITPSPWSIGIHLAHWMIKDNKRVLYVEVVGEGNNADQARQHGFRLAVEQAVGTVIASETEVRDQRIVRDEIISYASGFVEEYQIVGQNSLNNRVQLSMKVWVSHSSIARRLLNTSKQAGKIDGELAAEQVESLRYERYSGDRLVAAVLSDFPRRAFNIDMAPTAVQFEQNRGSTLNIIFTLSWNKDYLLSLYQALEKTSQQSGPYRVDINSGGFLGWRGSANFTDPIKLQLIAQTLVGTQPAVLLTIKNNHGQPQFKQCYRWSELDHVINHHYPKDYYVSGNNNRISINGYLKLEHRINLPMSTTILRQSSDVELTVVRNSECPNL